jgi:Radical SAM superfamily/4Fe-4S single cluster domain
MSVGQTLKPLMPRRAVKFARRTLAATERTLTTPRKLREANERIQFLEGCLRALTPQPRLTFFVMSIVDHCNLRCQGCDHFAAIARKRFVSLDDIVRDATRMSEFFRDEVEEMRVLGGEPLLHPQLEEILVEVRKCFPQTKISLTTNGILLPRQDEKFWTVCRENRITIVNTKYPINLDHAAIEESARVHEVAFEYYGQTGKMTKTSFKVPLDLAGGQDPRESFMRCYHANHAVLVMEGRIHTCTVAPNAHIFSERFGADLALTERDYLDIHKAQSKQEILEFLATPKPFCRYCNVAARSYGHPWERSKQEMSEWLVSTEETE